MSTATAERVTRSDSIPTIALNLMWAAVLSGLILATLNFFTQPIRERNEAEFKERARAMVLPQANRFEPIEGFVEGHEWFRGFAADDAFVGYVVPVKKRGY